MMAFGYEPSDYPPDWYFAQPPTPNQLKFLKSLGEQEHYTGSGFRQVCRAVLEEYGIPWDGAALTMGHTSVLLDFFKNAKTSSIKRAEQKAWLGERT